MRSSQGQATSQTADGAPAELPLGTVEEAMTREVLTVSPDSGLGVAARALEAAGVSGAPVVEGGKVVGIVTLQDLLSRAPATAGGIQTTSPFHRVEHLLTEISTRTRVAVGDVMTAPVTTVRADTPLARAARLMTGAGINRLPVVDEQERPCGILTRDDIVAAVGKLPTDAPEQRTYALASQHDTGLIPAEEGGDRRGELGGISPVPRVRV